MPEGPTVGIELNCNPALLNTRVITATSTNLSMPDKFPPNSRDAVKGYNHCNSSDDLRTIHRGWKLAQWGH